MNAQELIDAVHAVGASITTNGTNLILAPASKLSSNLKQRLKEHKAEVLLRLASPTPHAIASPIDSTVNLPQMDDVADSWLWIKERASILEIDGGLDSDQANHEAFLLWFRRFVGR